MNSSLTEPIVLGSMDTHSILTKAKCGNCVDATIQTIKCFNKCIQDTQPFILAAGSENTLSLLTVNMQNILQDPLSQKAGFAWHMHSLVWQSNLPEGVGGGVLTFYWTIEKDYMRSPCSIYQAYEVLHEYISISFHFFCIFF